MTGKTSFYQLPDSQKECQVHNREVCQTKMFLKHVRSKCSCVQWALTTDLLDNKVISFTVIFITVAIIKKVLLF